MRPIEFRIWNGKKMTLGVSSHCTFGKGKIIPVKELFILMQYTGLLDRNGKKIFEGDIVKYLDWLPREVKYSDTLNQACGFVLSNSLKTLYLYDTEDLEIIGNIFENPELLEELIK